jgi:hypothetical protein
MKMFSKQQNLYKEGHIRKQKGDVRTVLFWWKEYLVSQTAFCKEYLLREFVIVRYTKISIWKVCL